MNALQKTVTRDNLVRSAVEIMLNKGYTSTSVDQICEKAGVSKGSFFHYFSSKEELAQAALEQFFLKMNDLLNRSQNMQLTPKPDNQSRSPSQNPLERINSYLDNLLDLASGGEMPLSCLIGNFAQELSGTHPALQKQCAEYFDAWMESFTLLFQDSLRDAAWADKVDARSIAEYFVSLMEGTLVVYKAQQDIQLVRENILHFKKYLSLMIQYGGEEKTQEGWAVFT